MLTIRLKRTGKKSHPFYRIVAQDSRRSLASAYKEALGHWDPRAAKDPLKLDLDKVKAWQAKGASLSPAVAGLVRRARAAA